MSLTRRNTLIGLGTLAGGLGLISGTGAFDTVEANRDFTVEIDGDESALLQLVPTDDEYVGLTDDDNELLEISIGDDDDDQSGVNDDAVTTFNDLFAIGNNGTEDVDVYFEVEDASGESVDGVDVIDGGEDSLVGDEESEVVEVGEIQNTDDPEDPELSVGLEIDTTADGGYTEPDAGEEYTIVITANAVEA